MSGIHCKTPNIDWNSLQENLQHMVNMQALIKGVDCCTCSKVEYFRHFLVS
jgi:hypothetical protein